MLRGLTILAGLQLAVVGGEAMAQETRYFVVGGGNYAYHSQAALETNMKLFSSVAGHYQVPSDVVTALFGAGNDQSVPDVVVKKRGVPVELELAETIFGLKPSPSLTIRHNEIEGLAGPATRSNVLKTLAAKGGELAAGDKLRFYYTGHGAVDEYQDDRFLVTWEDDAEKSNMIYAKEFTSELDAFPETAEVQAVMVQCFSGGFANMNFVGGDRKSKTLSPRNRCGFFSQLATRYAAGCSPDLDQREEYSPYFFAAYAGRTEKGETVNADYNGDGRITSDEAHAFVLIHENSFDVPISTSSDLLRAFFKLDDAGVKRSWADVEASLNAVEREVVKGLSAELGFAPAADAPALELVAKEIYKRAGELKQANLKSRNAQYDFAAVASSVKRDVIKAYYESVGQTTSQVDVEELTRLLAAHQDYDRMLEAYRSYEAASEGVMAVERQKAKWERLAYLFETKYLESLLAGSDKSDVATKYDQLKTCEARSFFE